MLMYMIRATVDITLHFTGVHGPSVRINSYTHPVGLERVNGSEGEQGCGSRAPPLCIVSSGSNSVSELTDGISPDPEGTFGHNWAEGFFTVNRGNSSTIEIGFRLERSVVIGEVQLSLLNCPAWRIGAPNIALYGNINRFPEGFNVSLSTQLGSTTSPEGSSCTVQTQTVSSPLNDFSWGMSNSLSHLFHLLQTQPLSPHSLSSHPPPQLFSSQL